MARGLCQIVSNLWMPALSDRRGRRPVILISLFGSAVGYLVQGSAWMLAGAQVTTFIVGRGLGGLFGGTMPVIRAYVTELSIHDTQLLKQRMTYLQVASQAAGIVLAPIAGSLASFWLPLPFYISCGTAVLGLAWALSTFRDVSEVRTLEAETLAKAAEVDTMPGDMHRLSSGKDGDRDGELCRGLTTTSVLTGTFRGRGGSEEEDDDSENVSSDVEEEAEKDLGANPWCDIVTLLFFLAYMAIFITVSGYLLLLPTMLHDPSFGIVPSGDNSTARGLCFVSRGVPLPPPPRMSAPENVFREYQMAGGTDDRIEGEIAKAVGVLEMPQGLCNIFFSLVVFLPLTKRIGEAIPLAACGVIWACVYLLYGRCSELWHIAVLNAVAGSCLGLMIPAISPLLGRYCGAHYPKRMAQAMAIPIIGLSLAMAFGQSIMASVYSMFGLQGAWIVSACFVLIFVVLMLVLIRLVNARAPLPGTTSTEALPEEAEEETWLGEMREAGAAIVGREYHAFVEEAVAQLRLSLASDQAKLWSAPMQHLVLQRLGRAVPEVRPWDHDTGGREHVEDLGRLLRDSPEELAVLEAHFETLRRERASTRQDLESELGQREIVTVATRVI
eukprot:TRINITY_DN2945_c1_g2_i1.p1 TRINITY_DN2945_c1_g2~~TRINITY_DN2945_c1_g2_i1.p1  ORF type:complete len:687 (-),score=116.11 TRINITY_DN2945_c1_g2_i1:553-2391(-)